MEAPAFVPPATRFNALDYAVPPTVRPSIRSVGCPTPTARSALSYPSLPQVPTPEFISM